MSQCACSYSYLIQFHKLIPTHKLVYLFLCILYFFVIIIYYYFVKGLFVKQFHADTIAKSATQAVTLCFTITFITQLIFVFILVKFDLSFYINIYLGIALGLFSYILEDWLEKKIMTSFADVIPFYTHNKRFKKDLMLFHRIDDLYFREECSIEYNGEVVSIIYQGEDNNAKIVKTEKTIL